MDKLVLLPSAKLIPLELQGEFGRITSAMIPLGSRPAIHYISDYYRKESYEFLVAVHEMGNDVIRYFNEHSDIIAHIVDVGDTNTLGMTVLNALETLDRLPEYLVINFADTFIGDQLADGDVICYREQEDVYRWTTFQIDDQGTIFNVKDKSTEKNSSENPLFVFVGIFGISNVPIFTDCLRNAISSGNGTLDPYYFGLCDYYNSLFKHKKIFQQIKNWWDFGHLDTYYATKRALSTNCRYFNNMKVDNGRGIIQKTSKDSRKLHEEIGWYLKLPIGLQYMAPRIFDYRLSYQDPFVKMEFYGYPALNDMYLYGNYDIGVWNQIFDAIEHILQDMSEYRLEPTDKDKIRSAMLEMYEKKTESRLKRILSDYRFHQFCGDEVAVNGRCLFGLNKVLDLLPELAIRVNLYELSRFSIIHGDLCLSNILYDQRNRIVRIVDPRGGFGAYDIYGDPRYDIAKLCHSIEGDYDFIVNSLFSLKRDDMGLNFKVHLQKKHLAIKSLFRKRLIKKWHVDYEQIKLIESLLFLSMVPLHADRINSQLGFLSRGLELFTDVYHGALAQDIQG